MPGVNILGEIMLGVVMKLGVVMLSVIMLGVDMLVPVKLDVFMLSLS